MTDRELLEAAARAIGMNPVWHEWDITPDVWGIRNDDPDGGVWNPLRDDGDALRLAVKLGISVGPELPDVVGKSLARASWLNKTHSLGEWGDGDAYAATRRAIVRTAVEIGKAMP